MANGASRIFGIIKNTADENKTTSELATLVVKSLDPLIFRLDDKTDITEDFYELDVNFDSTGMQVGDIVKALVLNDEQLYYILSNIDVSAAIAILNDSIKDRNVPAYNNSNQIDPNTTLEPVILTKHANGPNSEYFYYIITYSFNGRDTNKNRAQIAYGYTTNERFQRYYYNGVWYPWEKIIHEETGTWAPSLNTIEGAAPTYTTTSSRGSYKKIGDMVFISFFIRGTITALNGADNYAVLKGLPFASKEMSLGENAISVGDCYNCVSTSNEVHYAVYNNVIRIQTSRGSSATKWQVTPSGQYFIIAGSGWYEIA